MLFFSEITCPALLAYETNTTDVTVGAHVTATCNGKTNSVIHIVCGSNGNWNATIPDCIIGTRSLFSCAMRCRRLNGTKSPGRCGGYNENLISAFISTLIIGLE